MASAQRCFNHQCSQVRSAKLIDPDTMSLLAAPFGGTSLSEWIYNLTYKLLQVVLTPMYQAPLTSNAKAASSTGAALWQHLTTSFGYLNKEVSSDMVL